MDSGPDGVRVESDSGEQVKLSEAASHLLNECRMVLPGIQAIFGFQLIAVFNERFSKDLESIDQRVHLGQGARELVHQAV